MDMGVLQKKIYMIRGHRVMLSHDLAELYQVTVKRLNEQVRRNASRFPEDFMFRLTQSEFDSLRSQIVTLKVRGSGGRRYPPYAFTEQGIAMLSSVLKSERAIQVNIAIMRAFVQMREVMQNKKELRRNFEQLERKVGEHDESIRAIFEAIRRLMAPSVKPKRRIGFQQGILKQRN